MQPVLRVLPRQSRGLAKILHPVVDVALCSGRIRNSCSDPAKTAPRRGLVSRGVMPLDKLSRCGFSLYVLFPIRAQSIIRNWDSPYRT